MRPPTAHRRLTCLVGWAYRRFDVSEGDRKHWDRRYLETGPVPAAEVPPGPPHFGDLEHLFPAEGLALDVACGRGRGAVWLANRGMQVLGVDVSPVGIKSARELAGHFGVGERCRFEVFDLDNGLPVGDPVELVFCYLFRDSRIDEAIIERLKPGGLLATVVMSEADVGPGEFRVPVGELRSAFGHLEVLDDREGGGIARILARRPTA